MSTAAAVAVAPHAHAAPAENPELIRLGGALAGIEGEIIAARDKVAAIIKDWSPRWPAAPQILLWKGGERDVTFTGHPVYSKHKYGRDVAQTLATVDNLQWHIAMCRRVLRGKRIDTRKIRGMSRDEWEQDLSLLLRQERAATRFEAKRARITKDSGINPARAARKAAFDQLAETVMETMGHDAATMDGVVIKALALEAWSRHAELADFILVPGAATRGQQLAASVLRLAGEA
jgi:hypothetical protein